jgi:hypothetical protein
MPPPPLPDEIFSRVQRIARLNGGCVLAAAGCFALLHAASRQFGMAVLSLAAAGAGVAESHGAVRLRAHDHAGVRWLVGSQVYLAMLILGYAAWRLLHFDAVFAAQAAQAMLEFPGMSERMAASGMTNADVLVLIRISYTAIYVAAGITTLVYQGGLALYYRRRSNALASAIASADGS